MKRIDLNMKVYAFFERNFFGSMKERLLGTMHDFDCETMREVCEHKSSDYLKRRGLGETTLKGLTDALELHGLSLGMSDEALDAYQQAYEREQGNKPTRKPNTIDWEQRRWEATLHFALLRENGMLDSGVPCSKAVLTFKEAVECADSLTKEYKLNMEG